MARTTTGGMSRFPYALVMPALLLEAVFVLAPLGVGLYDSFYRIKYLHMGRFVGFDNYVQIIADPLFLKSIGITAFYSFASLFFTFIVGFALAVWLERDTRWNVLMRGVVLVPYIVAMLVGSLLLKWIFSLDSGIMPLFLGPFGLGNFSILADPKAAMAALVFNAFWRDTALAMILLMAGLKTIPLSLYSAARVDGAGPIYTFWRITLPLMRIPIVITMVRLLLLFTNILTYPLVLTGGGPDGATETLVLRMYRVGFEDNLLGRGDAMAILLFLFNIVIVVTVIALFRQRSRTVAVS